MTQLQFPEFPQGQTGFVQPVLTTPGRLRLTLTVWERDDEPDLVVAGLNADDGDGRTLAALTWTARRDEAWVSVLGELVDKARTVWYDVHGPFGS